jgi:hypothetical protein
MSTVRCLLLLTLVAAAAAPAAADSCFATCCSIGYKWYGYGNYSKLGAHRRHRPPRAGRAASAYPPTTQQAPTTPPPPTATAPPTPRSRARATASWTCRSRPPRTTAPARAAASPALETRGPSAITGARAAQAIIAPACTHGHRAPRSYGTYAPKLSLKAPGLICNCYMESLFECS